MLATSRQQLNVVLVLPELHFNPNSGAQGEYAGLMVIRAYHNQEEITIETLLNSII
jgi:glycine dehydrogenase